MIINEWNIIAQFLHAQMSADIEMVCVLQSNPLNKFEDRFVLTSVMQNQLFLFIQTLAHFFALYSPQFAVNGVILTNNVI